MVILTNHEYGLKELNPDLYEKTPKDNEPMLGLFLLTKYESGDKGIHSFGTRIGDVIYECSVDNNQKEAVFGHRWKPGVFHNLWDPMDSKPIADTSDTPMDWFGCRWGLPVSDNRWIHVRIVAVWFTGFKKGELCLVKLRRLILISIKGGLSVGTTVDLGWQFMVCPNGFVKNCSEPTSTTTPSTTISSATTTTKKPTTAVTTTTTPRTTTTVKTRPTTRRKDPNRWRIATKKAAGCSTLANSILVMLFIVIVIVF